MDKSEVAPPLPTSASAENSSQPALVVWLVPFLLQRQAKYYIPDNAIDCLLKFLAVFFGVLGHFCGFSAVLAASFPSTLYKLRNSKMIPATDGFTRYVVCRKCRKLYLYDDCIVTRNADKLSKESNFIKFPIHPHQSCQRACDQHLLRSLDCACGQKILYPFKVYCCRSLQSSLQELLLCPCFLDNCQH